jgi:hypothetical protein
MKTNYHNIVLYSCTFSRDLLRTVRMVKSITKHNVTKIPFYISVPNEEVALFQDRLKAYPVSIFGEQEIIKANPKLDFKKLYEVSGGIRQQVIKSEFWRLGKCENYLVLDADCVFIRDFDESNFIAKDNIPYSVIHEGRELLQVTDRFGPEKTRQYFLADREPIKAAIGRAGITYDYGYAPFLWSSRVWKSFDDNYLTPKKINFLDAILYCGSEFTWYGESLVNYQAIPIYPREQLFKHYHYENQLWIDRVLGYTEKYLAKDYLGVVYQSNWEIWKHFGGKKKSSLSMVWRYIRRLIQLIIFKLKIIFNLTAY